MTAQKTKKFFNQSMTLLGRVTDIDHTTRSFDLTLRSGDVIRVSVGDATFFTVLGNLDGMNYDRVPEPNGVARGAPEYQLGKYLHPGDHVYVQGVLLQHGGNEYFDAVKVILMHYRPGEFIFEQNTHWWLTQIRAMADAWLQDLFGDTRDYQETDFAKLYRTSLNIYGGPTDDKTQAMATLSRLIYGLSSAYLLLGDQRMLSAASAGVDFQRTAFKSTGSEGIFDFWAFGRRPRENGAVTIYPSQSGDDFDTIPLYEQIYALAGLAQYYRITNDSIVLHDIKRTVDMMNQFYLDDEKAMKKGFPGEGGYFSHLDPVTRRPDSSRLGNSALRKNWNSIGDHLPAYLINVVLALDPLPQGAGKEAQDLLQTCQWMVDYTAQLIADRFPDKGSPYVQERFHHDWSPDQAWGWQKDRAIVGHNLKIAWNLTRVANYYEGRNQHAKAASLVAVAEKLGKDMLDAGLDQLRGGCFDAVERKPSGGRFVQCVWGNHKDFWQQEQAILAYLILYGYTGDPLYKDLYRDVCAWWNAFHLDHENTSIYFRINDNGEPYIKGRGMAGYDIAGYHSFELNYLAHVYMRCYVDAPGVDEVHFCLYFRPDPRSEIRSINVLPDFIKPDTVRIVGVIVDGVSRPMFQSNSFQIPVAPHERGKDFIIQFRNIRLQNSHAVSPKPASQSNPAPTP